MNKKNIIYILLTIGAFVLSSCNDVVKYNDGHDDQLSSDGAPTISYISKASDLKTPITETELSEMITIQGNNLTGLKSILLNDVEVDLKTVYALRTRITLPVPLVVPNEVTDLITVTTNLGTTSFPLVANIPDIVIDGIYNEFANSGDTIVVTGKYFDMYQLTTELGTFTVNGAAVEPMKTTTDSILFVMPANTPDGVVFAMTSPKMTNTYTTKFREAGISMLDINNIGSDYLTDGKKENDPTPLFEDQKFLRISGTISAWDWKSVFWDNFDLTDADVLANPQNYYVKFEINTKSHASISTGNIIIGGSSQSYKWNPGEQKALNTYGKWHTIKLELKDMYSDGNGGTYLANGSNAFTMSYQPVTEVSADFSMTNFRIVKK